MDVNTSPNLKNDLKNWETICRVCLKETKEHLVNIFNKTVNIRNSITYAGILMNLTSIQVFNIICS